MKEKEKKKEIKNQEHQLGKTGVRKKSAYYIVC